MPYENNGEPCVYFARLVFRGIILVLWSFRPQDQSTCDEALKLVLGNALVQGMGTKHDMVTASLSQADRQALGELKDQPNAFSHWGLAHTNTVRQC